MNETYPTELMPRDEAMHRALTDTDLEGLALHPEDRAVLDAWARHELSGPQAIDRLHRLLDAAASTLTPEERQTRAFAAFPTLRLAELQCYGLDQQLPLPTEGEPVTLSSTLTLEQQLADISAQLLASAQRLATDEKHRLEIQKLLF